MGHKAAGKSVRYLNRNLRCGVLPFMAEEKKGSKDLILWMITVALVALSIYWYMKPR